MFLFEKRDESGRRWWRKEGTEIEFWVVSLNWNSHGIGVYDMYGRSKETLIDMCYIVTFK